MSLKPGKHSKKDTAKKEEACGPCGGPCVASIAGLLEEHRAAISSSRVKMTFSSLEEKLTQTHGTGEDHGQRIFLVESNANLMEEGMCLLVEKCAMLADSKARLASKRADLEGHIRRNNISRIQLPESIEGASADIFNFRLACGTTRQPNTTNSPLNLTMHKPPLCGGGGGGVTLNFTHTAGCFDDN